MASTTIKAGQAQPHNNNFNFKLRKGQCVAVAHLKQRRPINQPMHISIYQVYDYINSFTQPNMDKLVVVPLSENAVIPTKGSLNAPTTIQLKQEVGQT